MTQHEASRVRHPAGAAPGLRDPASRLAQARSAVRLAPAALTRSPDISAGSAGR